MRFRRLAAAGLAVVVLAGIAAAGELAEPEGRVLLTVTGAIAHTNADRAARFDRDMLAALDWREIETHTPFNNGPQRFAGPTLASLIAAVEGRGPVMRAVAINDYAVEIPTQDAEAHDVLLAMEHDGRPMRIRDKGPIWVIYPMDAETAETDVLFGPRMIWQLRSIDFPSE